MGKNKMSDYKPGEYGIKRMSASAWAEINVKKWNKTHGKKGEKGQNQGPFPCICFSRQICVGALEIADLLSERIPYRVIDREILEYMAKEKKLSQKAVEAFDEKYPGIVNELFSMLISEKTYLQSDYAKQLAKTVTALAGIEPTIFVGRGTHLILPRDKVIAVRLVSTTEYRIERLAGLMGIHRSEAEKKLRIMDKEQHQFFKTVYSKNSADPVEFDLIINRSHISDASQAAEIIACAFEQKFGIPVSAGKKSNL